MVASVLSVSFSVFSAFLICDVVVIGPGHVRDRRETLSGRPQVPNRMHDEIQVLLKMQNHL